MSRRVAITSILLIMAALSVFAQPARSASITVTISGMHCESCASGITAMLKRVEGVAKVNVSYEERRATVDYDDAKTSPEEIIKVIQKMGYRAAIKK